MEWVTVDVTPHLHPDSGVSLPGDSGAWHDAGFVISRDKISDTLDDWSYMSGRMNIVDAIKVPKSNCRLRESGEPVHQTHRNRAPPIQISPGANYFVSEVTPTKG